MLWRLISLSAAAVAFTQAAFLPEQFASYKRGATAPVTVDTPAVWAEYGLESAERAEYAGKGKLAVTAYRLKDPTGAYAAAQLLGPKALQHENYVLVFEGQRPAPPALDGLTKALPGVVRTALPTLPTYFPAKGRVAGSERYVLGPDSLRVYEPRVPPDVAAFHLGAEAQTARYRAGGNDVQLTIFSYPTPQMAIQRTRVFEKVAGAQVKRSGPLVAVVFGAPDRAAVDRLLGDINYKASFTWNESVPKDTIQDAAQMILAILLLAFGLIAAALVFGVIFGAGRQMLRRFGVKELDEELTTLGLSRE